VLKQNFVAQKPDQAYVQDIIYVWTSEGWLYLAVTIWQRQPKTGLIVHSDQAVQ
jgi:putative transposase